MPKPTTEEVSSVRERARVYYLKGNELFKQEKYKEAIEEYTKAISIDKDYSDAYYNRGIAYATIEEFDNAIKDFQIVLKYEPNNPEVYYVTGLAYEYKEDYTSARDYYQKALELNPNYYEAKRRLERISEDAKREEAVEKTVVEEGQIKKVSYYKPKKTFNDVVGLKKQKEELFKNIVLAFKRPDLFKKYVGKAGIGILLYGPPGCGKTFITDAVGGEAGANIIIARINEIVDMYAGNTEKNMHAIFEEARKHAPAIIFFDEVEALGVKRGEKDAQQYQRMAVNQFLTEMDGIESGLNNIFVIGATNAPWDMDPALKRSGRFGKAIYVPPPDYATRVSLFKYYTKDMPIRKRGFGGIDYGRLARATIGYASVDIKQICYEAGLIPLVEEYATGKGREIKMGDFLKAIKKTKSSLDEWYMHVRKEIISKREVQIVDGKKTEIEKEGVLSPQERALYNDLIKDVKRNSSLPFRILKKLIRIFALYIF